MNKDEILAILDPIFESLLTAVERIQSQNPSRESMDAVLADLQDKYSDRLDAVHGLISENYEEFER